MPPLRVAASTVVSAVGVGKQATWSALRAGRSGLQRLAWETVTLDTCIGEVAGLDELALRSDLAPFDCRNNRLAQQALLTDGFDDAVRECVARVGAQRIGVFMGTSTSGILSSEIAYRHRHAVTGALPAWLNYQHTHNCYSAADFTRQWFGLRGPAFVISTACSSSAKVFGAAQRMLTCGLIDAAIVGGVDSLCLTTLYGFDSLQLLAVDPCRPFDRERAGLSIGEAAGYVLLLPADHPGAQEPGSLGRDAPSVWLRGVGGSCDAHHMSAPHPQALGTQAAMHAALAAAGVAAQEIGYMALHGTATASNDTAEAMAVRSVLGAEVPCSSIKGHTGHTLGAAGIVNAVAAALVLEHQWIAAGAGTRTPDPALAVNCHFEGHARKVDHVMVNALGFGGNNCSLVFSRERA